MVCTINQSIRSRNHLLTIQLFYRKMHTSLHQTLTKELACLLFSMAMADSNALNSVKNILETNLRSKLSINQERI